MLFSEKYKTEEDKKGGKQKNKMKVKGKTNGKIEENEVSVTSKH
jgi:hypothetical protein